MVFVLCVKLIYNNKKELPVMVAPNIFEGKLSSCCSRNGEADFCLAGDSFSSCSVRCLHKPDSVLVLVPSAGQSTLG